MGEHTCPRCGSSKTHSLGTRTERHGVIITIEGVACNKCDLVFEREV